MRTVLGLTFLVMASSCGVNETVLRSGRETPFQANATSEKTSFAKELEAMRTAGFTFVYALRRRNGGVMGAEDLSVIKLHTADTNRRVKADDDRAVIIGTNKEVPQESLAILNDRFLIENYSEPPDVNANIGTNSNK